jgi:hypothetical protein
MIVKNDLLEYIEKQKALISDLENKKAAEIKEIDLKYSQEEAVLEGKIAAAKELTEQFDVDIESQEEVKL